MFEEKKWAEIEPSVQSLPGGAKLCDFIRNGDPSWGAIAEAMYEHKGFPKDEFHMLAVVGVFDIRWPLTFAAWYRLSSDASVDQECAEFYTNLAIWEHVLAILPEYSGITGLSGWAEGFPQYRKPFQSLHPLKEKTEIPSLEEIYRKLNHLRTLDKRYQVFGAYSHQYKSIHLSESKIRAVEAELGVRLPEEYRRFLQVIGYGAGPYYGLYGPDEILSDLRALKNGSYGESIRIQEASKPFPITPAQADVCYRTMSEGRRASIEVDWPTDGYIPICNEGCTFLTCLVTAGELVGTLWSYAMYESDFNRSFPIDWNLAPLPPGITSVHNFSDEPLWHQALSASPTFLEWYNAWLDQCLEDLETSLHKQRLQRDETRKSQSISEKLIRLLGKKA